MMKKQTNMFTSVSVQLIYLDNGTEQFWGPTCLSTKLLWYYPLPLTSFPFPLPSGRAWCRWCCWTHWSPWCPRKYLSEQLNRLIMDQETIFLTLKHTFL